MARPGDRAYRFARAAHWAAGALVGFETEGDGLAVAPPLAADKVAGSEAGTLAAAGPCGRLLWLRPETGELLELLPFGAETQGRLAARRPRAIHAGPALIWVREKNRLRRFAARTLQELGTIEMPGLIASAADGHDGLWLLVRAKQGAEVRWLDARGRFCAPPITLPDAVNPAALAADPARRLLAVLDSPAEAETAAAEWRLHIVDLATCAARAALSFALGPNEAPPRHIAADPNGGFACVSATMPARFLHVSAAGIELSRQSLTLPSSAAPAIGLFWQDGPVLAGQDGLYRLAPASEESEGAPATRAIFITPTLISPPGTPGGWNRAEIAVTLPKGAALRATIFASSSTALADAVADAFAATAGKPAARTAAIDALLTKARLRTQSFKGAGKEVLQLLLDRIPETYVWLKLEVECPAGAGPATLAQLCIRYPDRSWLDELPAIYRDQEGPAAQLRQFLAPFEALYTELDETIDRLPARIDPETASDAWLPWLLGWLGFPPTAGLDPKVQRDLLREAGALLAQRGTIAALRRVLAIVTGRQASVEDSAAGADFWVISGAPARLSPRLGCDTRIVARQPSGFRPGTGMRLGEEPLPPLCTDVDRLLRARCARVTIRVAIDPEKRAVVGPILDALLAIFVPAHCSVDLRIAPAGRTPAGGRLDRGWKLADGGRPDGEGNAHLADPNGTELGRTSRICAWQLPRCDPPPFTVNGNAALDGARRLA